MKKPKLCQMDVEYCEDCKYWEPFPFHDEGGECILKMAPWYLMLSWNITNLAYRRTISRLSPLPKSLMVRLFTLALLGKPAKALVLTKVQPLRERMSRTGGKFLAYKYRPKEELVLRLNVASTRALPSSIRAASKAAIKKRLLRVRSLLDASIDFMDEAEKNEVHNLAGNVDSRKSTAYNPSPSSEASQNEVSRQRRPRTAKPVPGIKQ